MARYSSLMIKKKKTQIKAGGKKIQKIAGKKST
jgi:hypothetical protein